MLRREDNIVADVMFNLLGVSDVGVHMRKIKVHSSAYLKRLDHAYIIRPHLTIQVGL